MLELNCGALPSEAEGCNENDIPLIANDKC